MTARAPVVIVGGGIAGTSLAYALARRRQPAVLLERGRIGRQGASSGPAALVNPHRGRSARAHPDDLAGMAAFWRVAAQLRAMGLEPGAERSGVLRVAPSTSRARAWRRLASGRWLEPDEVPAPFVAPHGALLADEGGWVRPRVLLAALAQAAASLGTEVREGVRALRVRTAAGGADVHTSAGRVRASQVVLCVGADPAPELATQLPAVTAVAGEVVTVTAAGAFAAPLPALGGGVYAAFDGERAFVGGTHRDPETADPEAPKRLLDRLDRTVPGVGAAPVTGLWSGVRAHGATPRPLVAELGPEITFLGALSGRGFLCSAALAETLAARIALD